MVSEAGVLLIIVRDNRWVEVDWLVVVLVAMVAPLRPRTTDRSIRGSRSCFIRAMCPIHRKTRVSMCQ